MKKLIGFTLAEVLITLGIIGVVAAMTIPSLVANYKKMVYVTQLKKVYTNLNEGFKRIMANEGCVGDLECAMDSFSGNYHIELSDTDKQKIIASFEFSEMNSESCNLLTCGWYSKDENPLVRSFKKGLYSDAYKEYKDSIDKFIDDCNGYDSCYAALNTLNEELNGNAIIDNNTAYFLQNYLDISFDISGIMSDGTIFGFAPDGYMWADGSGWHRYIYIDTNGSKKPNELGRDVFLFELNKNGTVGPADYYSKKIMQDGWKMNY